MYVQEEENSFLSFRILISYVLKGQCRCIIFVSVENVEYEMFEGNS